MMRRRFSVLLTSAFALVALLLAALGVYGVTAFVVSQRTEEFGIRRALGAQRRDILLLVFRPGFIVTAAGIAAGLALSVLVTHMMASLLFGVSPIDPLTFGAAAGLLCTVAIVASFIPAHRTTRAPILSVLLR